MGLFAGISLFAVLLVLAAVPGASVALVVTRAATRGFPHGVAVAVGIVLADLVFVALALTGMALLAEAMGSFFAIVRICAGAALIGFGFRLIRTRDGMAAAPDPPAGASLLAGGAAGFLLTLGDGKAILFYASLFPAFVDMGDLRAGDVGMIVLVTVLAVGGVKVAYAALAVRIARRLGRTGTRKLARSVAGCAMIGTGAFLVAKG